MTSNESNTKSNMRNKNNLKAGSIQDKIETNENKLDGIIHNNYF